MIVTQRLSVWKFSGGLPACREKDPDPEGKQLAATKDPLGEATKLVQQLKQYAGDRMQTHLLAFEVGLCTRDIAYCHVQCGRTQRWRCAQVAFSTP